MSRDQRISRLMADLFPLNRSITGGGTRATLARIGQEVAGLQVHEVPSGTEVLDWRVPDEWNLRRARLIGPNGVVVDTADSNLHIVGYSAPAQTEISLEDLQPRLHSLKTQPTVVPYRTSYYERTWGFCLTDQVRSTLQPGQYMVDIDTSLEPGALSYGELVVPGRRRDEILISTHVCHPSLANDNLTGIAAAVAIAAWAVSSQRDFTYRILFLPATIGAVTWLARNRDVLTSIRHGVVLTGLGDPGHLTYKRSRRGDTSFDRLMTHVVQELGGRSVDWSPYGYDERQFCSPGFDLPVGRLSRTPHGTYPEYHTSADNLSFVSPTQVGEAIDALIGAFELIEEGIVPRNLAPYGEPQLGRRGLFRHLGGSLDAASTETAVLWLLSLGDGAHDLMEIADRSQLPLAVLRDAARALQRVNLLAFD